MSLSESRLPQTSAVSGQEATQVSKIRKLTGKLDWPDLLRRVYFLRNKNRPRVDSTALLWCCWRQSRFLNLPLPVLLQRFSLKIVILFLYTVLTLFFPFSGIYHECTYTPSPRWSNRFSEAAQPVPWWLWPRLQLPVRADCRPS